MTTKTDDVTPTQRRKHCSNFFWISASPTKNMRQLQIPKDKIKAKATESWTIPTSAAVSIRGTERQRLQEYHGNGKVSMICGCAHGNLWKPRRGGWVHMDLSLLKIDLYDLLTCSSNSTCMYMYSTCMSDSCCSCL